MKVAIVGAGLMGRWHATYAARAGATVAAVIDKDGAAAAALAKKFGAGVVSSIDGANGADGVKRIEAVHVCTPLKSHAEWTRAALEAGAHVLCEKPLTESADETRALLELAAKQERVLCPVHQFPFQRGYQKLLKHRERLGRIVHVAMHAWTAGADGRTGDARRAVLREILPHPISLLRPLGMDLSGLEVRSHTDDELAIAGSSGGASVLIDINLVGRPTRNELLVAGSDATATVDLYHGYSYIEGGKVSRLSKALRPLRAGLKQLFSSAGNLARRAAKRQPAYPGLPELIAAFYAATRGERGPPVSPEEMTDAAEWIDRVRSS